ncbi:PorT family protein [Marinilongibacter aquaticus]|uniref:PorT family protein n=1 Tax=Marinilongibacter aquaticus TaxID=2975157 RepID=UPI0021BD3A38|nr:PorT family protein [Marinilongibacter aquaticus]UBM59237.1 PorT family protein [Marinilongibacter aquaticus]
MKNLKKLHNVLGMAFLLLLVQLNVQAQWEEAYYINSDNKRIEGQVFYENWAKSPASFRFRASEGAEEERLGLEEVQSLLVHNERYLRASVELDETPVSQSDNLPESPSPTLKRRTVFLLSLIEGPKSLYMHVTAKGRLHLYIENEGVFVWLSDYKFVRYSAGGTANVLETNSFRNQLKEYLYNCPTLVSQIERLTYSDKAMQKLFTDYYAKCADQELESTFQRETKLSHFGLMAGIAQTSVKFDGKGTPNVLSGGTPTDYGPTGGIFWNIGIPRTKQRFSFQNEVLFSSYSVSGSRLKIEYGDRREEEFYKLGLSYMKLNVLFRAYLVQKNNFGIYCNAGMSNGFVVSAENEHATGITSSSGTERIDHGELMNNIRKYEQGFVGGIGVKVSHVGFEARYENANGMSPFEFMKSTVQRLSFLVAYQF